MKEFWSMVQLVFTGIGGWLGYFLGGCDGLIIVLLLFVLYHVNLLANQSSRYGFRKQGTRFGL